MPKRMYTGLEWKHGQGKFSYGEVNKLKDEYGKSKELDDRVIRVAKDGRYLVRLTSALSTVAFGLGTGDRVKQRVLLGLPKDSSLFEKSNKWIPLELYLKLERVGFSDAEWKEWQEIKLWYQNINGGKDWYRLNKGVLDKRLKTVFKRAQDNIEKSVIES